MRRLLTPVIAVASLTLTAPAIHADVLQSAADKVLTAAVPANSALGPVKVKSVNVSPKTKTVTVNCSEAAAYIPFTADSYATFISDMSQALGNRYSGYKVVVKAGDKNLSDLVLYAPKKNVGPTETDRFVTYIDGVEAPQGLDGANIALWQSHGWYFEPKLNRWEWQRARIFETVEDLYTQTYVMPYLMPMLENAGAYVMSPRERDTATEEFLIDHDINASGYSEHGHWKKADMAGFSYDGSPLTEGRNPFAEGTVRIAAATTDAAKAPRAVWAAPLTLSGKYAVYVSYASLPNSAKDALYTIHAADADHQVKINQQMGGGTWIYLGHYDLDAEQAAKGVVELTAVSSQGDHVVVTADAVKIGGGTINVARRTADADGNMLEYVTTDYPRFTGGARYQLQWAGAPDSLYTPTENVNDYTDDYRSRGLWVNWLTGGSSMLPGQEGLGIPVDLSFAFHSDAGTTMNDDIIGTLGIYCTVGDTLGNGSSRNASRDFTDLVMTNIVNDVRAKYEPNWTRRGMWDKSYFEARVPAVPAMLLELLSHQNFADMKYGLDPRFRFDVSRAIYKGMLQFIARRDGRDYVVQPLAVNSFAINPAGAGSYTLSWHPTVDSLEATATPAYYIVEERIGDGTFKRIARVTEPTYTVKADDGLIHSYRVIAGNDGGVSFPSEVLALCYRPDAPEVLIVNGFTRVSAPDWFDSGEIAGFYNAADGGVADGSDIGFIGEMVEFRRDIPWMDDDAAGFGASRATYETKVLPGNTFDYPYIHGRAFVEAGYGFVSSSLQAFVDGAVTAKAPMIDLILGKQKETAAGRGAYGTEFKTFTPALQQRLRQATSAGTSLLVSGSYVASDLWDNPHSTEAVTTADKKFASEVLGFQWRSGRATEGQWAVTVQNPYGVQRNQNLYFAQTIGQTTYGVESPDGVFPADKRGATFMRYTENNLPAGVLFDAGTYRTAILGFPLEVSLGNAPADGRRNDTATVIAQILNFLNRK